MARVRVQTEDFDLATEIQAFTAGRTDGGALASFIGLVRDVPLNLEHYPGMTETALETLHAQAMAQFDLLDACLIHRVGALQPGDQIVLTLALSRHRQAALDAVAFLMDRLKTDAPFWKLEPEGWVTQRAADRAASAAWQTSEK